MKYKTHKNTEYTIIKNTSEVNKQRLQCTANVYIKEKGDYFLNGEHS